MIGIFIWSFNYTLLFIFLFRSHSSAGSDLRERTHILFNINSVFPLRARCHIGNASKIHIAAGI
jgi:hypothetical protein